MQPSKRANPYSINLIDQTSITNEDLYSTINLQYAFTKKLHNQNEQYTKIKQEEFQSINN